jgi:hypothetical protein
MSKTAYELRYDLLALSYDLLSQGGKNVPSPGEIIAAAKEFNDFVSNDTRKVISVDVGNLPAEDASRIIQDLKRNLEDAPVPKGRRKLFEDGEGSNLANFAHKLDDFAHQAVGLALQEAGCCGDRKDCNGGNDSCDCGNN